MYPTQSVESVALLSSSIKNKWNGIVSCDVNAFMVNPYLTNGFSHHYQLDESTFIVRGVRSDFFLSFISFLMKFLCANRIVPSGAMLFVHVT